MSDADFVYAVLLVVALAIFGLAALIEEAADRARRRRPLPPPSGIEHRNVTNLNNYRVLTRSGRTHGYPNGRGVGRPG